ncbi:ABC transporter permease subunit [Glycomyces tenuis]|uniref:ABC transporter permease subunit n=1 Tax=Glycomyces tenuis TaxID=58116 RepID=UPI0003FBDDC3|nr:ABC transporter permease subunit [Glycomyces tenuis]
MIWLTLRQFRIQSLIGAAAIAATAIYLAVLGTTIRTVYDRNVTDCTSACDEGAARQLIADQFGLTLMLLGGFLIAVPALIGAFWGAPMITRELETGTHRLVWNQSVTRRRWLTIKLAVGGGASVITVGALSLMLTWAAHPYDTFVDDRFTPLTFAARNLAPLGYAALAFVVGLTVGLLTRRTLAAMAITLVALIAFQVLMANMVRPNMFEPETDTVTVAEAREAGRIDMLGFGPDGGTVQGYTVPGAWVLTDAAEVVDGEGNTISHEQLSACESDGTTMPDECLTSMGAQFTIEYQPGDRYWTFQWIELGLALALTAILIGVAFWKIPRGLN